MLIFEKLRYKNFLSVGNEFVEVDFLKHSKSLIIGMNGRGKSSLLDALSFVLFNRAFRSINKPQLVNSITKKQTLVEVEFRNLGHSYLIKRGIKPNVLEIWVDGKMLDQSSTNQSLLEKQILRLNFNSFSNIYILGSASYIPFMKLKPENRREVIENLLDLSIFSNMNSLLKGRISDNQKEIDASEQKYRLIQTEIETILKMIKYNEDNVKNEISELESRNQEIDKWLSEQAIELSSLNNRINELRSSVIDVSKELSQFESYRVKMIEKCNDFKSKLKFFKDHDDCPICSQNIQTEHKDSIVDELTQDLMKYEKGIVKAETEIAKYTKILDESREIEKNIRQLTSDYQLLQASMNYKEKDAKRNSLRIEELQKNLLTADQTFNIIDKRVIEAEVNKTLDDLKFKKKLLLISRGYLKDDGIKSNIIRQFIPVMNERINHYLEIMNFMVSFELSETFEETIKSRYRDTFSYDSFSEGEKFRINLAILFAWRDIAKMRNSISSNLLIMDEILDSSLDDDGIDDFFKIIESLKDKTNIFVISHKSEKVYDKFDRVLEFKKKHNFTYCEEVE